MVVTAYHPGVCSAGLVDCRPDGGGERLMAAERTEEAKQKNRQYVKETYWLRKRLGICTRCGKEKAAIGFTQCPDCQEKNARETAEYYAKIGRKKRNKIAREQRKALAEKRKEAGLCTICGKKFIPNGFKSCNSCRAYNRAQWKKHNPPKGPSNWLIERKMRGVCLWCEEQAVDGYAYCESHLEQKRETARKNILPTYRAFVKNLYGERAAKTKEKYAAAKWNPPKMENTLAAGRD